MARAVWITRAQPGADETAARVRGLGLQPLVSPVLEVRRLTPEIDLDGVAALVFTSRNAVTAWAALSPGRDLPVLAVGDATAEAAREVGFGRVESARGDVHDLAALIDRRAPELGGRLLHPRAAETAEDLAALVRAPLVSAPVYETVEVRPSEALDGLARLDVVLVHSPKAARTLARLVARSVGLTFLCISDRAAAPLLQAGHEKVLAAPFPAEAALLKLLREATGQGLEPG
jgi:uroporphyrinogen-III synthase